MNTKIITALVIATALVGLVGVGLVCGQIPITEPPTVDKTVDPTEIYVDGTDCAGLNEETTLTITVTGAGEEHDETLPLDIMLVLDQSGSMCDEMELAKNAAKHFVDLTNSTYHRTGLVTFGRDWCACDLRQGLTFDQQAVKNAIDPITCDDNTPLAGGISLTTSHFETEGDEFRDGNPVRWHMVLLTDGCETCGGDPIAAAEAAADKNITIWSIGLGSGVCEDVLRDIAEKTGGKYYYVDDPEDLDEVYDEIYEEITIDTRPWDVDVVEVTEAEIKVVGPCTPAPDSMSTDPSTGYTTLIWNDIGDGPMGAGETVTLTCTVKSTEVGEDMPVQVEGLAVVNYKDSKGNQLDPVPIPQAYLTQIDLWIGTNKELDELIGKVDAADMPNIIKNRLIDKLEYAKKLKDNAHEEYEAGNIEAAKKKLGVAKDQVESFEKIVKITRRISPADKKEFLTESALIKAKIDCLIEKIQR